MSPPGGILECPEIGILEVGRIKDRTERQKELSPRTLDKNSGLSIQEPFKILRAGGKVPRNRLKGISAEKKYRQREEDAMTQDRTPERDSLESASERTPNTGIAPDQKRGGRERLAVWWARQPLWVKVGILGGGMGVTVFLVVFAIGKFRAPRPVLLSSHLAPGPMSLRPRVPIRSHFPTPVNVAGIEAAGGTGFRTPASSSAPFPARTVSPSPQGLPAPPSPSESTSLPPEVLWRQMGAVAVDVARLNQAIQRLDAENVALLRGQEWIEREMSKGSRSQDERAPRGSSAPLADDQPTATPAPADQSPSILRGWRVIGVAGNGAVLVDTSGQDHLVRKGRTVQGVQVTGIDPETGEVTFSDGEVLKP